MWTPTPCSVIFNTWSKDQRKLKKSRRVKASSLHSNISLIGTLARGHISTNVIILFIFWAAVTDYCWWREHNVIFHFPFIKCFSEIHGTYELIQIVFWAIAAEEVDEEVHSDISLQVSLLADGYLTLKEQLFWYFWAKSLSRNFLHMENVLMFQTKAETWKAWMLFFGLLFPHIDHNIL